MRVSSQSIPFLRLVVPTCAAGAMAVVAACAPTENEFPEYTSNNVGPTPTMSVAPGASMPVASALPSLMFTQAALVTATAPAQMATSAAPMTSLQPPVSAGMPSAVVPVPSTVVPAATTAPATTPTMEVEPTKPTGEGNDLVPNDEYWVASSTNGVGVEGAWYEYTDGMSTAALSWTEGGEVCVAGETAAMSDTEWGAGMGFILNSLGNNKKGPWDGSAYSGFSFTATVTGDQTFTTQLAIDGIADGQEHEAALKSGANTVKWTSVEQPSWVVDAGDDVPFDKSAITDFKVKIASVAAAGPYKVCISALKVMN